MPKNRYVLPRLRRYHSHSSSPLKVITIIVPTIYGITVSELCSKTNLHTFSKRRHLLMCFLARNSFLDHTTIGRFFGYSDHVMVSHSIRFVNNLEFLQNKSHVIDPYLIEYFKIESVYKSFTS